MLKQQKKYPNPEEPCKVKFLLQLLSLSKIMRLATKHKNHQASFRQLHSPPTPSFPMAKEMHLLSAFPLHFAPRLSSLHFSLQFTQQSNSGPCCNISHPLPNAADFPAFPGPPNSVNSIHSPSSSLTPAHSPAHQSAP